MAVRHCGVELKLSALVNVPEFNIAVVASTNEHGLSLIDHYLKARNTLFMGVAMFREQMRLETSSGSGSSRRNEKEANINRSGCVRIWSSTSLCLVSSEDKLLVEYNGTHRPRSVLHWIRLSSAGRKSERNN